MSLQREAFVLMTALPPTVGHLELIKYASALVSENHNSDLQRQNVTVVVCTQPGEPYAKERYLAIRRTVVSAGLRNVIVLRFDEEIQQEPEGDNDIEFWNLWRDILYDYGFRPGDYLVSSELYGVEMAERLDGVYMPFDTKRHIQPSRARNIRDTPRELFRDILPEFRPFLRKTITFFGAESVGKTTTSYLVSAVTKGRFLHEWARPYLEAVGPEVTLEKMHRIHEGQKALQVYGQRDLSSEFIFQDTDLFSTLGYWELWSKETVPDTLAEDALRLKSDLYVILSSDIPFEPDALRYGGDARESSDQYWIDLCKRYSLPFVYITDTMNRWQSSWDAICEWFPDNYLSYKRQGKEYENV